MSAPLISAENLTRSFTVAGKEIPVLRGLGLSVAAGERVFLTGPSGAGKTTLLYTLAALESPDAGEVHFDGDSVYRLSRRARARLRNTRMGYIFQNYFLLPELTALENVALPASIASVTGRERAEQLLGRVGLADRLHHLPAELSGGEQQRVAIARALVNDPDVVFADEPTGNLDSDNGRAVMELLLSVVADDAKTLIVVTHDRSVAALGDREITITDGRLESAAT